MLREARLKFFQKCIVLMNNVFTLEHELILLALDKEGTQGAYTYQENAGIPKILLEPRMAAL